MADDTVEAARHALFNEIDDCIERAFAQHGKGSGRVIELTDALIAAVRAERLRVYWLMECNNCHTFGTPMRPDETVCGNCGNDTDTRMWFRYLPAS